MTESMIVTEVAVCWCGEPDCDGFGWPHEWDPIASHDSCALLCGEGICIGDEYVRWGSGYAHRECVEAEEQG